MPIPTDEEATGPQAADTTATATARSLEAIFDGFADPFYAVDREWRFTAINRAAEAMLRRTRAELVGAHLWTEFPEAVGTAFHASYLRAVADGTAVAFEAYYPPLQHWSEVRAVPTADGLAVFFRDCTERRRAEDALRFLAEASAHLGAFDPGSNLPAVAELAVPAFADGCSVELLDERGEPAEVATAHADPAKAEIARELRRRWPPHRSPAHPLHEVLRTGRSLLASDVPEEALAALAVDEEHAAASRALGVRSAVVVPLRANGHAPGAEGKSLGAMTFVLGEDRCRYGPKELEVAEELARRVTLAIERGRLLEAERAAAERALRVQAVTAALAEALTVEQVAAVVAERILPALGATGFVLRLVDAAGWLRVARAEGYGEAASELFKDLPPDSALPIAEVVRRRSPLYFGSPEALGEFSPERGRAVLLSGKRAWAFLPLVASGRAVGSWGVGFAAERRFAAGERALMATLAGACAQALERARLYEQERDTAAALQGALLPERLAEVDGTSVAVRYRPGGAGAEVGGDWYDVVRLPQGTVGVAVGDVTGHGIAAAAVMGQLRNAMRAYATEGHPPATVVALVNRLLSDLRPDQLATCCYVELDPAEGTATVVRAGHPPPVLVGPDGAARLAAEVDAGLPLGVDPAAAYGETTLLLAPGATVVLYTDGLVESAAVPLGEGMERLVAAASGLATAEDLADRLVAAAPAGEAPHGDDVALLVLRYGPVASSAAGERCVHRRLASDRASAGAARRFVADVLAQWGTEELGDTAVLLVSELVTNAVVHTATDVELGLVLRPDGHLRVEVADEEERQPDPEVADDDATSGRGLFIVEALADAWGVEARGAGGKVVWFELAGA